MANVRDAKRDQSCRRDDRSRTSFDCSGHPPPKSRRNDRDLSYERHGSRPGSYPRRDDGLDSDDDLRQPGPRSRGRNEADPARAGADPGNRNFDGYRPRDAGVAQPTRVGGERETRRYDRNLDEDMADFSLTTWSAYSAGKATIRNLRKWLMPTRNFAERVEALEQARARDAFNAAQGTSNSGNASSRPSPGSGDPDWDRAPFPNILRIGVDQRNGNTSVAKDNS